MVKTWAAMATEETVSPSPFYYARLAARMQNTLQRREGQPNWLVAFSVAIALILGFALGSVTSNHWAASEDVSVPPQLSSTVTDFSEDSLAEAYWQLAQVE